MKTRRFVVIASFVAPLLVVAACSFPDVTFGPGTNEGEGGTGEGGNIEGAAADAADSGVSDAPVVDVVKQEDGSGPIRDPSLCETRPKCDCDNDEYADKNCDVDASVLRSAKGNLLKPGDCDDLDDLAFPGQTYVEPTEPGNKDYDCSGGVEFFPPQNITCGGNGLLGCTGLPGFLTAPVCGSGTDYYACAGVPGNALATCTPQFTGNQAKQACK